MWAAVCKRVVRVASARVMLSCQPHTALCVPVSGAGESRQRRAAAEETPMQRAVERAALREELARLWTGLLDAQQGECLVRRGWLADGAGSGSNKRHPHPYMH